jgi:transposase IS481 family protein
MDLHANAALSLNKRRLLCRRVVEERWTLTKAAAAAEVSVRCARKWVARYRADGVPGLADRSSAPARVANRTPEDRGLGAARAREGPSSRGPARSALRALAPRAGPLPGQRWRTPGIRSGDDCVIAHLSVR